MQENMSPQTPHAEAVCGAKAHVSPATAPMRPRLKPTVATSCQNQLLAIRLRADVHFSREGEIPKVPLARRTISSLRSSCSSEIFLASSSPFEVRVMGVDCVKSQIRWYLIRLVCRQRPGSAWEVVHRFSEFDALANAIRVHDNSLPPLPRRVPSLLLSGTQLQRRIVGLQQFSEAVLSNPHLLSLSAVGAFFDLNFGLWHDASTPPPRVDRAQQRAARMLQAKARRWLSMQHLRR